MESKQTPGSFHECRVTERRGANNPHQARKACSKTTVDAIENELMRKRACSGRTGRFHIFQTLVPSHRAQFHLEHAV